MKTLLTILVLCVSTSAFATGWHKPPMTNPPVVAPPSAQPTAQASMAKGAGVMGWYVMGFVLVFYYLSICQLEEERDPEMFKTLMCPETPSWKFVAPFTATP